MKVVKTTYKLLDGEEHTLLKSIGNGRVIRLFNRTPYPEKPTDVVCPHFHELAVTYGCPYNCSWCYLKGTFRFFQRTNGRIPVRIKKQSDVVNSIKAFLQASAMGEIPPTVLNTGELADSLCTETNMVYGEPLSKFVMKYFNGTKHKVLFLSKGTNVKNFLENDWRQNAILSWSLNAYPVAERWEKLAPSPKDRIEAAKKVSQAGYEVRVRIDPMVAIEGYEEYYQELVADLFDALIPTRITLGCLRGLTSTMARAVDKTWISYLDESSSWGRKPALERRFKLYSTIMDGLIEQGFSGRPSAKWMGHVAVCKDTLQVWEMLEKKYGLNYRKIKCNCIL